MTKNVFFAALTAVVGLIAMTNAVAADPNTLTLSLNADIRSTEPGMSPDDPTGIVLAQILEGLVAQAADGSVKPMLADSIDVSPDAKTYTFALRKGVTFHDGTPLNASVVAWNWKRYLDPKTRWSCRSYFDGSQSIKIDSVDVVDANHVRFTLAAPSRQLLPMMARTECDQSAIVSPASVDATGNWLKPYGTGPYMLQTWNKGQSITLKRFAGYKPASGPPDGYAGDKTAYIDTVRFLVIPDESATKAALQSGSIDIWYSMNAELAADLKDDPSLRITSAPGLGPLILLLQTADPVMKDVRIRRALAMAIDAAGISQVSSQGLAPVDGSLVTPTSRYYKGDMLKRIPYDITGARKLLSEAGYHGQPIAITTNTRFKSMYDTALAVQAMAQQAGLNVTVKPLEFASMLNDFFGGHYQVMTFSLAAALDPTFTYDRFIGDKTKQASKVWDSAEARNGLAKLLNANSDADKQAAFVQLHDLMLRDVPIIGLTAGSVTAGANKRVLGFAAWPGRRPRLWGIKLAK
ncbi:TPA: ABC transporter substrate-binding protein [Burkholderia multivorans]|nr:ABC transporter substrate-binding protein [Burkholderia multivorans]